MEIINIQLKITATLFILKWTYNNNNFLVKQLKLLSNYFLLEKRGIYEEEVGLDSQISTVKKT